MRKFSKIWLLLLAAVLVLGLVGCKDDDEQDDVDWTNYSAATRSISLANSTSVGLVGFADRLELNRMVGGLPANANNHGFSRVYPLDRTNDSMLIFITEAEFNARKNSDMQLRQAPIFSMQYVFYNADGTNNTVFRVSGMGGIGGNELVVHNPTQWNVELRLDGPEGQTLGFAARNMLNTTLYIEGGPGDILNVFPVFRRYSPAHGEIIDVFPRFAGDDSPLYRRPMEFTSTHRRENFDLGTLFSGQELTSGGIILRVTNSLNAGGFQVMNGGNRIANQLGNYLVRAGQTEYFVLRFASTGSGANINFPAKQSFSLTVAVDGMLQQAVTIPMPEGGYDIDYIYEVVIAGTNVNDQYLASFNRGDRINADTLFGGN